MKIIIYLKKTLTRTNVLWYNCSRYWSAMWVGLYVAIEGTYSERVCVFFMFKDLINRLKSKWDNRKWTMYLFYNGILIGKKKIRNVNEIDTVFVRVVGHKTLFGSNMVGLVVKPIKLLKTDEKRKKTYWGTTFEKGVDI